MAAKKKAAAKEPEAKDAPKSGEVGAASTEDVKNVYRVDLGESLPPQAETLNPNRAD